MSAVLCEQKIATAVEQQKKMTRNVTT